MKQGGRSTISRVAFPTELLYNREGASDRESSNMQSRDSKSKDSRKRKPSQDKKETEGNKRKPCWICDGPHSQTSCFLALEIRPKRGIIPEENKEVFGRRMKDPSFAKKIQRVS